MVRLGGFQILVSFEDFKAAWMVIKRNEEVEDLFVSLCQSIRICSLPPGVSGSGVLATLYILGMGIYLIKLNAGLGANEVAKEKIDKSYLKFCWALIQARLHHFINEEMELVIFGRTFLVAAREETSLNSKQQMYNFTGYGAWKTKGRDLSD